MSQRERANDPERQLADGLYGQGWSGRIERDVAGLKGGLQTVTDGLNTLTAEVRTGFRELKRSRHPSFGDDDLDLPTGVTRVRELPDAYRSIRAERDEAQKQAIEAEQKRADDRHAARVKLYVSSAIALLGALGTLYGMIGR